MAKVLIVDDSRTSRKILKEILKVGGHEILGEASNGEEGVILYKYERIGSADVHQKRRWERQGNYDNGSGAEREDGTGDQRRCGRFYYQAF